MEHNATLPNAEHQTPTPLMLSLPLSTPSPPSHPPHHNPYHNNHNYHSKQQLTHWLQTARKTHPPPKNEPSTLPTTAHPTIQTTLPQPTTNIHWGNLITLEISPDVMCIVSKNMNSLNTDDDFVDWKAAIDALAELQASVCAPKKQICAGNQISTYVFARLFATLPYAPAISTCPTHLNITNSLTFNQGEHSSPHLAHGYPGLTSPVPTHPGWVDGRI